MNENPFLLKQPEAELQLVNEFQQHSRLDGIRLKEFRARSGDLPAQASGKLRLDLHHETRSGTLRANNATFDVAFKIRAELQVDTEITLLELECCLEANYHLAPNFRPSEQHLASFRKVNVLFHCWPYLRELVQNITWRMGLILPPLPLLRVVSEADGESAKISPVSRKAPRRSTKSKA